MFLLSRPTAQIVAVTNKKKDKTKKIVYNSRADELRKTAY